MTWPQIKTLTINWGSPAALELHTRRPVLWCNGTVVPRLGDGLFEPPTDGVIELKPTGSVEYDIVTNAYRATESREVKFLDAHRAFSGRYEPTPEQLALYRAITMVLDAYDPSLAVDSLRGCFGMWYGELGFLEYRGESVCICSRLAGAHSVPDIIAILDEVLDPGPWGMGNYDNVPLLIAQAIYNARRLYRGELPEPFEPLDIPKLEYLPPPVRFGVE